VTEPEAFIRANTLVATPPLVPEIRLFQATEITPIWQATEAALERMNVPPPYWAFAWPGGQALARYLLDHPERVAGKQVMDFAAGSGLSALAAKRAGAAKVQAVEIDPVAACAIRMNAALNGLDIEIVCRDLVGEPLAGVDLLLAGDVCYERPMAGLVAGWLRGLARGGLTILMGDPGRTYLPGDGLIEQARYVVPTSLELEDKTQRETVIWQFA
jgi:predicted nicotinamide N-methyase